LQLERDIEGPGWGVLGAERFEAGRGHPSRHCLGLRSDLPLPHNLATSSTTQIDVSSIDTSRPA
jgi:hypothetical protein